MNFLGNKPIGEDLRFSAAESFRLCTQGLRFLEQYESTTSAESLKRADDDLSRCVTLYPSDVLPKFYLGSVKTLQGFQSLEEAKSLFNEVIQMGGPALSFAAKYNLAVAHVEEYTPEGFSIAETLLREMAHIKPKGDSNERMIWAAKATLLYVRADRLWKDREKPTVGDLLAVGLEIQKELSSFESDLNASSFVEDREIRSDVLNAKGTLHEFLYYASSDPSEKDFAKAAATCEFEQAAGLRVDYVNSMSNLARLKQDVFGKRVEARQMWDRLLETGKSTHYIHYNLGKIDLAEGNTDGAVEHFRAAAPKIPEAQTALEKLEAAATASAGANVTP